MLALCLYVCGLMVGTPHLKIVLLIAIKCKFYAHLGCYPYFTRIYSWLDVCKHIKLADLQDNLFKMLLLICYLLFKNIKYKGYNIIASYSSVNKKFHIKNTF